MKDKNYLKYVKQNKLNTDLITSNMFAQKLYTHNIINVQANHLQEINTLYYSLMQSKFKYLTSNLFKLFFTNSKVEVPKVLINFKSLVSPKNQVVIYKFNNYLTLHGGFIKSLIYLNTAWNTSLTKFWKNTNYFDLWLYSNYMNKNFLSNPTQGKMTNTNLKSTLAKFIRNHHPIFTFYIYKISKNIYKNTRGKSGKFMFTWKYVPIYKRLPIVTTWLIKELRVLPQRTLPERLVQLIINIIKTPNKTWTSRVKVFSYNYVYTNCRKTLASTYIATKN
jgi:hypothetical protein